MKLLIRMIKRTLRKILSFLSSPIKATEWYKSKFVDYEHKRYPDNVWYREHDERNFDVVNLGSSGGRWAFDWQGVGVKGMNWANQPQTLIDDFRLLKNFHSILHKNGIVVITIMPFTGLNKKTGVMDTFKYLGTLCWDIAKDMPYVVQAERLRSNPILFGRLAMKAVVKHLLRREKKTSDWRETIEKNPMSEEQLKNDADAWMSGWARQFGIIDFEAPLTDENLEGRNIRVAVMREIVDFCVERGYRPVYVIPPVSRCLAARFTPKFRDVYIYSFLKNVDRDVQTLDYLDDEEFQDSTLYFNSFFLNKIGRIKFTQKIWSEIQ